MSWLLKGQTIALSVIHLQKGLICILNFEIVNRENYQSYAFGFDKEVKDTKSLPFLLFMFIRLIAKLQ
jgi:hypothetical protein